MTNYCLSYDITDDRLRRRLAKTLLAAGCKRLQKSVFFVPDFHQKELTALRAKVTRLMQSSARQPTDSVLVWAIPPSRLPELVWEGDEKFFDNQLKGAKFLIV